MGVFFWSVVMKAWSFAFAKAFGPEWKRVQTEKRKDISLYATSMCENIVWMC